MSLKRKERPPDEEVVSLLREVGIDTTGSVRQVRARGVNDEWVTRLARALPGSSVRDLDLADNDVLAGGATALSEALKSGAQLERLSLGGAENMRIRGVRAIAKALPGNKTLRHLDLSWCSVAGSEEVVAALGHNDTLESLNLAGVRFRTDDFSGLAQNHALRRLNVRDAHIRRRRNRRVKGPAQAQARKLCEAINENTTLEELDLGGRNQGTCDVVGVLATHPSITRLNLDGAGFRNKHAAALGRALSKNTTLLHLNLANNDLGSPSKDQVQCFVNGILGSALRSLDISGNPQWGWYVGKTFYENIFRLRHLRHLNLPNRFLAFGVGEAVRSIENGTFALESLDFTRVESNSEREPEEVDNVVLRALEDNKKKTRRLRAEAIDEVARKRGGRLRPWDFNLSLLIVDFAGSDDGPSPPRHLRWRPFAHPSG